jgi:hypothetical protein
MINLSPLLTGVITASHQTTPPPPPPASRKPGTRGGGSREARDPYETKDWQRNQHGINITDKKEHERPWPGAPLLDIGAINQPISFEKSTK